MTEETGFEMDAFAAPEENESTCSELSCIQDGKSSAIRDRKPFLANHSGYPYEGSENFEHDDTGSIHNFSGCLDEIVNAEADHNGLDAGYDY